MDALRWTANVLSSPHLLGYKIINLKENRGKSNRKIKKEEESVAQSRKNREKIKRSYFGAFLKNFLRVI